MARRENDAYYTPACTVEALCERPEIATMFRQAKQIGEPCCGDGSIMRAIDRMYPDKDWCTNDIDPNANPMAADGPKRIVHTERDYTKGPAWEGLSIDVNISNPPYKHAMACVQTSCSEAKTTIMLLRLGFLASAERAWWMRRYPPDVYILPNRPSFTDDGRTDSSEYAWFVWRQDRMRETHSFGSITVLAPRPKRARGGAK